MSDQFKPGEETGVTGDDLVRRLMDAARRDAMTWADRIAIGQAISRIQHARDSAELRRLCGERDDALRQRNMQAVDIAAYKATISNLGRLVDELRTGHDRYEFLRGQDLNAISRGGVFAGKTPENVVINGADLDAHIDIARAAQARGGAPTQATPTHDGQNEFDAWRQS